MMNAHRELAIAEALERAKARYKTEGYTVKVRPEMGEVPVFLEGYIPDLIARKGGEGVVVAVKPMPPTESDDKRAEFFARKVQQQPGWRFDLHLASPRREVVDAAFQPSLDDIRRELDVTRRLASEGDPRAALIYGWGLLEAVARLSVLGESPDEARRYRPASVVSSLEAEGLIGEQDAARLMEVAAQRNLVVHGFTKTRVAPADVEFLLNIVETIIARSRQP
jgi:hypothetical protein